MNIQEKKLIEAFIQDEDRARHERAVEIIFHGQRVRDGAGREILRDNPAFRAIRNAVNKCFSGDRYFGRREEVYETFVSEFYQYLKKLNPAKLREIQDLSMWMFKVAANFANSNRKKINSILQIEEGQVRFTDHFDREEDEPADSEENSSRWAEDLLARYINQIQRPYFRDLLHAVKIEGMSVEDFAEEQGKSVPDIHRDTKRAMDQLVQIALPDIRWRSRQLYSQYKDRLSRNDQLLLDAFFRQGADVRPALVVMAFRKLVKLSVKEQKEDKSS